jgi:hypothetical protein
MVAPPCAMVIFGAAGDATLFQRADNIEAGWQAMQPILDAGGGRGATGARWPRLAALGLSK